MKKQTIFFFLGGGEGGGVVQKPKRYRESPKTAYLTPEWYENHLPSLFYGRTPPPPTQSGSTFLYDLQSSIVKSSGVTIAVKSLAKAKRYNLMIKSLL